MSEPLAEAQKSESKRSNPWALLLITLIGVGGGLAAYFSVPAGGNLSQQVPPWVFGTMLGSSLLFIGHLAYQVIRVLSQPEA